MLFGSDLLLFETSTASTYSLMNLLLIGLDDWAGTLAYCTAALPYPLVLLLLLLPYPLVLLLLLLPYRLCSQA